jgi:hypothetical protein
VSDLEFKAEGPSFDAKLRRLTPEVKRRGIQELTKLVYALREEARTKFDEAGLHSRTAALKGSIEAIPPVEVSAHEIIAKVVAGQKLKYAWAQEEGGVIKAKNARFLAIPLDAAKTAAGVARFGPRQIESAGYTGSFVKGGILYGKQGDRIVPLFVFKRSVTLPKRAFMKPALAAMQPRIRAGFMSVLDRAVKE